MTYEPGQRCLHNNNKLVQNINFGANFGDNLVHNPFRRNTSHMALLECPIIRYNVITNEPYPYSLTHGILAKSKYKNVILPFLP